MKKPIGAFIAFILSAIFAQAQKLNVDFITPSIVRVQWTMDSMFTDNETGVCIYEKEKIKVKHKETEKYHIFTSSELIVKVNKEKSAVSFIDKKNGKALLKEHDLHPHGAESVVQERIVYNDKTARMVDTANGKITVKDILRRDTIGTSTRYCVNFSYAGNDAIYGLGSHMEDYMNLRGKTMYLTQHNLKVMIPMLISPSGYGLLFDAGCAMKFSPYVSDTEKNETESFSMELEAARQLDYYFIHGEQMDDIVAGYHYLTGKVSLMPRYLFGYTQSKERYVSSDDIIKTLREYRRRHVPIDMIVQDWNYWPQGWGYMKMNPKFYPSPKALADSVHAMNAKLMVSIWPNPQKCPQEQDFRKQGFMLEHSTYDAFSHEARKYYWKYANDEFFSRGFDAWWCDCSEPLDGDWKPNPLNGEAYGRDSHEQRWILNKNLLSDALGAERSSLYSLYHSRGIYENQRLTTDKKRVVNLTRSSYAGQQRYGTMVWNGDTYASWQSFRQQIPAGLNYMATGNPYWTVDVGSFFTRNDGKRWFYSGEFQNGVKDDGFKEYYTRMFQWGTFLPMLRSHGTDTPREIWQFGEKGTSYYDAILKMIHLRYSLIPYIYSMAAMQSRYSYTMARCLAFDFPNDTEVLDIKDEYMFGSFLVCPITYPLKEKSHRKVYLPKGTKWTDYWTNKEYEGGKWIEVRSEIDRIPLFIRCGSIIPTTEVAEYTGAQVGKPVTINIYPGKNTMFELYEDEGDNYNYENGLSSTIVFAWDEKKRTLTINQREGHFPGMQQERTFIVRTPLDSQTVSYDGRKTTVRFKH